MKAKILVFDIETSPILSYHWGLFDQNIPLNQIQQDWHMLSWAAKWYGDDSIMYMDMRNDKTDKRILKGLWKLLDQADIVLTQNGKSFDMKKVNARFVLNGIKPPSSVQHIDTLQIARRKFGFTSNKLAYMTEKLCTKYKKLDHREFPGFELHKECLAGNKQAWRVMEKYNKYDVLSLEELYSKLSAWDGTVNFNLYSTPEDRKCLCGKRMQLKGYYYTSAGKYQRYRCMSCGKQTYSGKNLAPRRPKCLK